MKKAIVPFVLGLVLILLLARLCSFYQEKKPVPINWKEAHQYYDQPVIVEGKIVRTHNSGKACFLNFHGNWRKYLTAVIFAKDFSKFPEHPEEFYYLKTVQVTGIVKEYQGKPEILLRDSSHIKILEKEKLGKDVHY